MARLVLRFLRRKDGVRQRYLTRLSSLKKRGYLFDRRSRTWFIAIRPREPVREPEPLQLFRKTFAINYVVHHAYHAIVHQSWSFSRDRLAGLERQHAEDTIRALERLLGFSRDDFWFPFQFGSGIQLVAFNRLLDGTFELRNERKGGGSRMLAQGRI